MQCPLCGGPLRLDRPERFACRRGHELSAGEAQRAATARVSMAVWMAIEALESQAEVLRIMATGSGEVPELAEQADEDARILREIVLAHSDVEGDATHDDRAS